MLPKKQVPSALGLVGGGKHLGIEVFLSVLYLYLSRYNVIVRFIDHEVKKAPIKKIVFFNLSYAIKMSYVTENYYV